MDEVRIGKYRHFKGNNVEVIGIGKHSETLEEMVVYIEGVSIWVRPKKMFLEKVVSKGKEVERFKFLGD